MDDFAVFILTHGRAGRVATYHTLRKQGYDDRIVLVIDDTDPQIEIYKQLYGDEVYVFCKQDAIDITDSGDNLKKTNTVLYARNYCWAIAEDLGLKYFLVLDDDYEYFDDRFTNENKYAYGELNRLINDIKGTNIFRIDVKKAIYAMLEFYKSTNALTICFAQAGDFFGGANGSFAKYQRKKQLSRKAMNSFFCATDRPFKYVGRLNDDVNTYVSLGLKGEQFFTYPRISLKQKMTQTNKGGLTDIYMELGTYVKSFYSVMYAPSCVSITTMGVKERRIHHRVSWNNACPLILSEKHKKATADERIN
jgi:hypothetical protein